MKLPQKVAVAIGSIGLFACGIGGVFVCKFVDIPRASNELDQVIKESKAVGIPMTAVELDPRSGTGVRDPRWDALDAFGSDGQGRFPSEMQSAMTSKTFDWAAARVVLNAHKKEIEALRSLVKKPDAPIDRDWDLGVNVAFPEYASAKSGAKTLCALAQVEAHEGRFEECARTLEDARALGLLIGKDPSVIATLVAIALDAIIEKATEHCLALAINSPDGLNSIKTIALSSQVHYDLANAFRGEAYVGISTCRNFKLVGGLKGISGSSSGQTSVIPARSLSRSGLPREIVERAYLTRMLQYWVKCLKFIESHPGNNLALTKYLKEIEAENTDLSKGASYAMTFVLVPVFSQACSATVKGQANHECVASLAKVLLYRQQHGKFPSKLADAGVTATDPFDGDPLRYRTDQKSARVWSVGPDGIDDNGISYLETKTKEQFDVVASYPPIARLKT